MQDEVGDAELAGHADQRLQVRQARVHAAVGDEPDQVHALGARERRPQHLVLGERPVLDRVVDARQVLTDDRAGAEVEVPDLRVAHLPVGQPDGAPAGRQLRVRVARPQLVEDRRVGQRDRVARARRREPPAVEHHQRHARRRQRRQRRRQAHAPRGGDDRRERLRLQAAPPTSAPSTSGSASSSAALSGLTLPP